MKATEIVEKLDNCKAVQKISAFIGSAFFPLLTAAVTLVCYYMGWDMVTICYLGISAIAMLVTCRDITPSFVFFLFINIIISVKNSPSPLADKSDYFVRPEIYIPIIVVITLAVATLVVRLGFDIATGKFRPDGVFYGLCGLSFALLANGAFSDKYTPMDLMYGFFLAAMFIGIYMLLRTNKVTKKTYEKIAGYFAFFSVVLMLELCVAYLTYDGLIVNGEIDRGKLTFGWGMYNTIGMLTCICIPAWFYLAIVRRHGWIYTIMGIVNVAGAVGTLSRQSMIGAAVAFCACAVWLLVCRKGRERIINIVILAATLLVVAIIVGINFDKLMSVLSPIGDNIDDGNGRFELWRRAIEDFKKYPIFGIGFFGSKLDDIAMGFVGLDIIPYMYHNTLMQMLGACGIVGIVTYVIHRAQTIISLARNLSLQRVYLAITLGVFLLISLFDNHLFYLFPTLLYTAMIGTLKAGEKSADAEGAEVRATAEPTPTNIQ